jgi:SsrA-binding protein
MANYAENKKVHFDYEVMEEFEAGIELLGFEVKSIRVGRAVLSGSHVIVRGGEAYIIGMQIPPYQAGNTLDTYDPLQTRKLLLTKREIGTLEKAEGTKGLTIVPISLYNKKRKIKVRIAIVRGKKKFDKRETIKKRDTDRDLRRELKVR